jgi:hypothetical protein
MSLRDTGWTGELDKYSGGGGGIESLCFSLSLSHFGLEGGSLSALGGLSISCPLSTGGGER